MSNHASHRRHELLASVAEHTAQRLQERHGLDLDKAVDIGNDLADWMADYFGGQSVYFVKDEGYRLNARDREIFEKMSRGNAHEIAAEYGISFVRVYAIYRRCLAELRKRQQPALFGDDEQVA